MRFYKIFMPVMLLSLLTGCGDIEPATEDRIQHNSSQVQDGLYLIHQEYLDSTGKSAVGTIIPYSHDFLDEEEKGEPLFLDVDTAEFVPLTLGARPDSVTLEDKRINLLLSLTPNASEKLADFTGRNLNKRVAIVIGGEAVTKHKVKSKIEGGRLQVTRCTDDACRKLYFELRDNVVR